MLHKVLGGWEDPTPAHFVFPERVSLQAEIAEACRTLGATLGDRGLQRFAAHWVPTAALVSNSVRQHAEIPDFCITLGDRRLQRFAEVCSMQRFQISASRWVPTAALVSNSMRQPAEIPDF